MDSNYYDKIKYYEYVEKQREKYIDLRQEEDVINKIVDFVFCDKPFNANLINDENMTIYDIFCMYLEIALRGLHLLAPDVDIFSLEDVNNILIEKLQQYMKKLFVKIQIKKANVEDIEKCFIQIAKKDCDNFPYIFHEKMTLCVNLEELQAYFLSKNNIYLIRFSYIIP